MIPNQYNSQKSNINVSIHLQRSSHETAFLSRLGTITSLPVSFWSSFTLGILGVLRKTASSHTISLRKIQRIFWPTAISIGDLLARCQQEDMGTIIARKRWRWIGHVLHKGCQLHHQSCNPLDPRGKAQAWSTEDNLAKNCGNGNEEREPQLGHHPEAGQRQSGVKGLCCCPLRQLV